MSKYNKIMKKIEVTEEMRSRILDNIQQQKFTKTKKVSWFYQYKKYISVAACFVVLIVGITTIQALTGQNLDEYNPSVLVAPDYTVISSANELSKMVGFVIHDIDSLFKKSDERIYVSFAKELAEISYTKDNQTIYYRKSVGTKDNSGVHNTYDVEEKVQYKDIQVIMRGNNNAFNLATWTDGTYSYSIYCIQAISKNDVIQLVTEVYSE